MPGSVEPYTGETILYGDRGRLQSRCQASAEDWRYHMLSFDLDKLGIRSGNAFKGWSSTPAGGDYWCGTELWAVDLNFADGGDFPAAWIETGKRSSRTMVFAGTPPGHMKTWINAGSVDTDASRLLSCHLQLRDPEIEKSDAATRHNRDNPILEVRFKLPSGYDRQLFQAPAAFLQAVEKMHGRGPFDWKLHYTGVLMGYDDGGRLQGLVKAHPLR